MAYFLAPRSGEKSYKNFTSTIKSGVPYENIERYLNGEGKEALLSEDIVYAWGNRDGTKSHWEKMQYGDTVIFYANRELVMSGEVYFKQHSPELALAMWPPDENGNPWEYTFFLRNLKYFNMPMRAFNWRVGFKDNFIVQGFMTLMPERVTSIIEEYGSLENLLDMFAVTESNEAPSAKEKLYVNVPRNTEIIERSAHTLTPKVKIETNNPSKSKPKKIDHIASNKAKAITGSRGEAIAVRFEKERLRNINRPDLADQVVRVSVDDDTVGYDIRSFNEDGSVRHVEVKTSSAKSNAVRFYMSANEMKKSKELDSYFIYFVDGIDTHMPRVTTIECPLNNKFHITADTYLLQADI